MLEGGQQVCRVHVLSFRKRFEIVIIYTVTRRQITNFLCAAIVLLAMAVSSVAACACGHHQAAKKQKAEPISCHGASHESPKTETPTVDNGLPSFDENCICSFGTLDAAIVAKSETKRSPAERSTPILTGQVVEIATSAGELASTEPRAFSTLYFYSAYFPRSGPSRAPPRL